MKISELDLSHNAMQNVKRRFFALRNGVVADVLRKSGSKYRIIFGLNLPQLQEVAQAFGKDTTLAAALWQNDSTRESRLLAPMLVEPSTFSAPDADKWIDGLSGDKEEIDILCHFLLRKCDFRKEIIDKNIHSGDVARRYLALRLCFSLLATEAESLRDIAESELRRDEQFTRGIAAQLRDEADFVLEG